MTRETRDINEGYVREFMDWNPFRLSLILHGNLRTQKGHKMFYIFDDNKYMKCGGKSPYAFCELMVAGISGRKKARTINSHAYSVDQFRKEPIRQIRRRCKSVCETDQSAGTAADLIEVLTKSNQTLGLDSTVAWSVAKIWRLDCHRIWN